MTVWVRETNRTYYRYTYETLNLKCHKTRLYRNSRNYFTLVYNLKSQFHINVGMKNTNCTYLYKVFMDFSKPLTYLITSISEDFFFPTHKKVFVKQLKKNNKNINKNTHTRLKYSHIARCVHFINRLHKFCKRKKIFLISFSKIILKFI